MVSLLSKARRALTISRPIFWLAPLAAYAAGLAIAGVQRGWFEVWEMALATFPLSFCVYAVNDYYDMEHDRVDPRKGGIWGARMTIEDVPWAKALVALFIVLAIATGIISGNPVHLALIGLGVLLPYFYSAPPVRLKSRPILDSLSNTGYAFIPFAAAASLGGSLIFLRPEILLGLLMVAAFHAISTVMDHERDRKAGDTTFSTALGPRAASAFATAIFLINIPLWLPYSPILAFSVGIAALLSLWLCIRPSPERARTIFKALIGYGIAVCYFFLMKYLLFPAYLADYSESEISLFHDGCRSGDDYLFKGLCPYLLSAESSCSEGEAPAGMDRLCGKLGSLG